MNFHFSQTSLKRMSGVDGRIQKIAHRAIEISVIDFGIPEYGGIRTTDEQRTLYEQGKSKCDGVQKRSHHQAGRALDVYAYVDGRASWDKYHLAMVAAAMLQAATEDGVKLVWGGLWKGFPDCPHFQM